MKEPKEEAKELVGRFMKKSIRRENDDAIWFEKLDLKIAKQCAWICEDATIKRIRRLKISALTIAECNKYSREVKQEIEKLKK